MNNVIWSPQPKQLQFMQCGCFEVCYGGAAGGGKSQALVAEALRQVGNPNYRAIIFRKSYKQLAELIDYGREIYIPAFPSVKFNKSQYFFEFPSGAKIYFASIQNPQDVKQYQGRSFAFIAFDELTHFEEKEYMYMLSRCRARGSNLRCYIRSTCNPGGPGHNFVKKRFVDLGSGKKFVEEVEILSNENKKIKVKRDRMFISSSIFDNQKLLDNDPNYLANLALMPEKEKNALLYGDWNSFEGQFFTEFNPKIHVIKPSLEFTFREKFVCMDYGLDTTAAYLCGVLKDESIVVMKEIHQPNLNLSQAAKSVLEMIKGENVSYIVASPDLWNRRQETGKSGEQIMRESELYGMRKANDSRIQGWRNMREYLKIYTDVEGYETAKLKIFSTCTNLINNIPALLHDDKNVEDASSKPHDVTHAPEALRYGLMSRNTELNGEQYKKIFNRY